MAELKTITDTLLEYLKSDTDKAIKLFKEYEKPEIEDYKKEFEGDRTLRDSQVGRLQDKQESKVTKIPFSFQKKIVHTAATFLFGKAVKQEYPEVTTGAKVGVYWKANKMDVVLQKFCRMLKSETQAVLFFYVKNEGTKRELKIRLYGSEHGKYTPLYDEYADLIAFKWEYEVALEDKKEIHVWIFTADTTWKYRKTNEGWNNYAADPNGVGKIPVVFMMQENPEWWDVKELIDRYETGFSKFCDTNDYFGSPTLVTKGTIKKLPSKEKMGKAVNIPRAVDSFGNDITGDVSYLTWTHAPESMKIEWDTNKELIYSLTDTPDVSFDNLKGFAPASGYALEFQFLGAINKANESKGDFTEMIKRIVSLIMHHAKLTTNKEKFSDSEIEGSVEVIYQNPLPHMLKETIDTLMASTAGKAVLSQATAITLNPMVLNPDEEIKKVTTETNELNASFNL